jgi:hypothetical protein
MVTQTLFERKRAIGMRRTEFWHAVASQAQLRKKGQESCLKLGRPGRKREASSRPSQGTFDLVAKCDIYTNLQRNLGVDLLQAKAERTYELSKISRGSPLTPITYEDTRTPQQGYI